MTKEEKFSQIEELISKHYHIDSSDDPDATTFEYIFYVEDCNDYASWKNYFQFSICFDDETLTTGSLFTYDAEMIHDGFSYSYGSINGFQEENYVEPKWNTEKEHKFSSFEELLELIEDNL